MTHQKRVDHDALDAIIKCGKVNVVLIYSGDVYPDNRIQERLEGKVAMLRKSTDVVQHGRPKMTDSV